MNIVGYVALALLAVLVIFGLIVLAISLPSISRYTKIRKM
jgi:hypothetical protein